MRKVFFNRLKNRISRTLFRNKGEHGEEYRHHQSRLEKYKYSYSQAGEDMILDFLLQNKAEGFYVDIGAYHPVHLSNTHKFYERGWTGIEIEPNPERARLFKRDRKRSNCLNIGIASQEGISDFFRFESETLSTFSRSAAQLHQKLGHKMIESLAIQVRPLSKVLTEHAAGRIIDIMSVDVEGYDMEVLKTNDWRRFRPSFLILETAKFSQSVFGPKLNRIFDPYMKRHGYEKVADTYVNTIYVSREYKKAH